MKKILLLIFLTALLAPPAHAEYFPKDYQREYRWAESYWNKQPELCGHVERNVVPREWIYPHLGQATQPWKFLSLCRYEIADGMGRGPIQRCRRRHVMIHEYGHLLGMPHSEDPESPMYPYLINIFKRNICPWLF